MSDNKKAKKDFTGSDISAGSELWKPHLPQLGPETMPLKRFHNVVISKH